MKVTVKVDVRDLGKLMEKRAKAFPAALRKGLLAGVMRSLPIIQQAVREAPPANPQGIGSGGAVNTGNYLQAWRAEATSHGARLTNLASPYNAIIEHGRRAGSKAPRTNMIAIWAQRRLGLSPEEAKRAAWPIAQAIKRRGLVPRRVAEGALDSIIAVVRDETRKALMSMMANPK